MNFICYECAIGAAATRSTVEKTRQAARRWHRQCRGGTWCDCQHRIGGISNAS